MQDGVREEDVKFHAVEQILTGLDKLEKLVMGIQFGDYVSLR